MRLRTAVLSLLIAGCASVPYTDRKRVMLISDDQAAHLGSDAYRDILSQSKVSNDPDKRRSMDQVAGGVVKAAGQDPAKWEFTLIDDDKTVNAFALPGGKVGVYTGMWQVVKDDTDLAVVIGHEIAHVLAEHGGERVSQGLMAQFGGIALGALLSDKPQEAQQLYMTAYGLGATVGVMLPFSRLHEEEADEIGLIFMAKAGYDPRRSVEFWERMAQLGGAQPPWFLSTHPPNKDRIEALKKAIPAAMKHYKGPRSSS